MRPQVLRTKTQTAATWSTADGTKSQPTPACGERLCQGSTTARSSNPRFKAPYVNHPKLSLRCGRSLENGGKHPVCHSKNTLHEPAYHEQMPIDRLQQRKNSLVFPSECNQ